MSENSRDAASGDRASEASNGESLAEMLLEGTLQLPIAVAPLLPSDPRQEIEMLRLGVLLGTSVRLISITAWMESIDPPAAEPLRSVPKGQPALFADDLDDIYGALSLGGGDLRYHGVLGLIVAGERAKRQWAALGYDHAPDELDRYLVEVAQAATQRLGGRVDALDQMLAGGNIQEDPEFQAAMAPLREVAQASITAVQRVNYLPSHLHEEFRQSNQLLASEVDLGIREGIVTLHSFDGEDMSYASMSAQHASALGESVRQGSYPFVYERHLFVRSTGPMEPQEMAQVDDQRVASAVADLGLSFIAEQLPALADMPLETILSVRNKTSDSLEAYRSLLHEVAAEASTLQQKSTEYSEFESRARQQLRSQLRDFSRHLRGLKIPRILAATSPTAVGGWAIGLPALAAAGGVDSLALILGTGASGVAVAVGQERFRRRASVREHPFYFLYRLKKKASRKMD